METLRIAAATDDGDIKVLLSINLHLLDSLVGRNG